MSLKNIPKVDLFLEDEDIKKYNEFSNSKILGIVRKNIEKIRNEFICTKVEKSKEEIFIETKKNILKDLYFEREDTLKEVINGTGILIHTNLGRSVLSKKVAHKISELSSSYSNLEYDIFEGKRSNRIKYVEKIICDITGAESALVVNNNASSVFLVLNTLAQQGEVVLSRGEMVEVGGSFRVSEIIENSGCIVKEVGTTNKTKINDYKKATTENTKMYLKVHTSNFKVIGFTQSVSIKELVSLKEEENNDIIVFEDMGSGVLVDLEKYNLPYERKVQDALNEGADLVCFSGDKLLGGPQAGIIVGKKIYIDKLKQNQMLRCLRIDKLCLIALVETLKQYVSEEKMLELPLFKMATYSVSELRDRANKILDNVNNELLDLNIDSHRAMFGGGSLPDEYFESVGLYITSKKITANKIEKALRKQSVPIISTVSKDSVILNMSTIFDKDISYIAKVLNNIK